MGALVRRAGRSQGLTQALVARILVHTIEGLDLHWPEVSEAEHQANLEARMLLEAES